MARWDQVDAWVKKDLTGVKICELLARDGVVVAERAVQRFIATERTFDNRRDADGPIGHHRRLGQIESPFLEYGRRRSARRDGATGGRSGPAGDVLPDRGTLPNSARGIGVDG